MPIARPSQVLLDAVADQAGARVWGGPGEYSNSVRLQAASRSLAGWHLLRAAAICFRLLPTLETHKLGPGPCLTPEALIRDVWADDPQETEPD